MREIKFRAWCENSGENIMINEYLFINKENNHGMGADFTNDYPCVTKVIDVMQYTGYNDSFGTEIYEGDFIEAEYDGGEKVLYYIDDIRQCFVTNTIIYEIADNPRYFKSFKIVGNIHQNPELEKFCRY